MAIKKKEDKASARVLPGDFDELLHKAFTEQFLSSKYEELFKDTKAEVLTYIKATDEFEVNEGEGFKTEYGSIILSKRKNISVDKSKLAQLVEDGVLTVDQLIGCVSTFKNEDLEKTISSLKFKDISTMNTSETFTFKGTTDFKASCDAQFSSAAPTATAKAPAKELAPAKAEVIVEEAAPSPKMSIAEKAKAAVSKKVQIANPDADLDAILNSKSKGK